MKSFMETVRKILTFDKLLTWVVFLGFLVYILMRIDSAIEQCMKEDFRMESTCAYIVCK